MDSTGIGQVMIERYLREQRYRFFRAEDGECLVFMSSKAGPFQLHLRTRNGAPNVVKFGVRAGLRFPLEERGRLLEWVNRWNDQNQWLTASVRPTTDGSQLRVVGNSTLFVVLDSEFAVLRRFADLSLASATKLFEAVNNEMALPSPTQLEEWFEWTG